MKRFEDYSNVKLKDVTGALKHHSHFTTNKKVMDEIKAAVQYIKQNGVKSYVNTEYPAARTKTKNIIINNISGRLFVTDGNKHCVSLVITNQDITIGDLLNIEPCLFRYWEEGYEEGGDKAYQPYVTYIPVEVNVSRIPSAKQGVDDKNNKINIIPSNIPYDSALFDEADRGRPIIQTAHLFEVEEIYLSFEAYVEKASSLSELLGYCGKMYDLLSRVNIKYGFADKNSGYDHTLIWFIAGRVLSMSIADKSLSTQVNNLSNKELAEKIFNSIEAWVRGENK